jgi:hypothetical protein
MTGKVEIISRTYRKIKGKYYARVRYKIDDGKPLDNLRQVRTSLRSNRSRQRSKLNY